MVERIFVEAIVTFMGANGRAPAEDEAINAAVPLDQPKLRYKPAYKHCVGRLDVRGLLRACQDSQGNWIYEPTPEALKQLEAAYRADDGAQGYSGPTRHT